MRVKFTILICVVALLFTSTAFGQGYSVNTPISLGKVIYGGNNQELDSIRFIYHDADDRPISADAGTITITFGGLTITNPAATDLLVCGAAADVNNVDAAGTTCGANTYTIAAENDATTKAGKITVSVDTAVRPSTGTAPGNLTWFAVQNVRLDVSGLAVEDKVMADIATSNVVGFNPFGGATSTDSLSGAIAEVANGLALSATQDSGLSCGDRTVAPSITVGEGFAGAWHDHIQSTDDADPGNTDTWIKIAVKGLGSKDTITWLNPGDDTATPVVPAQTNWTVSADLNTPATPDDDTDDTVVGTLTPAQISADVTEATGISKDTSTITLRYSQLTAADAHTAARSFKITPHNVSIADSATLDIHAILIPHANDDRDDLATRLSFEAPAEYPMDGDGNNTGMGWAVVSDCVTYLLYPFVTCGSDAAWSTGISVSNTSMDGDVFGAFDQTKDQSGAVVMYGFPKHEMMDMDDNGEMDEEMMEEMMPVSTISENLEAGNTITFACSSTEMAGMEGYAIIKAYFQHARGMAFVMGNFRDGASTDVTHGYMAEVIIDPATRSDALLSGSPSAAQ